MMMMLMIMMFMIIMFMMQNDDDDEKRRDFILYLCPVGDLQTQLNLFWQKSKVIVSMLMMVGKSNVTIMGMNMMMEKLKHDDDDIGKNIDNMMKIIILPTAFYVFWAKI